MGALPSAKLSILKRFCGFRRAPPPRGQNGCWVTMIKCLLQLRSHSEGRISKENPHFRVQEGLWIPPPLKSQKPPPFPGRHSLPRQSEIQTPRLGGEGQGGPRLRVKAPTPPLRSVSKLCALEEEKVMEDGGVRGKASISKAKRAVLLETKAQRIGQALTNSLSKLKQKNDPVSLSAPTKHFISPKITKFPKLSPMCLLIAPFLQIRIQTGSTTVHWSMTGPFHL